MSSIAAMCLQIESISLFRIKKQIKQMHVWREGLRKEMEFPDRQFHAYRKAPHLNGKESAGCVSMII